MNRLHLDFSIHTSDERRDFVNSYLNPALIGVDDNYYVNKYNKEKEPFPFPYEPTYDELETIANYILYGKSKSNSTFNLTDKKGNDGTQSVVDAGYIEIPTRNSPWQRKQEESLDSMLDIAGETGNPIETQYNLIGGLDGHTKNDRPRYRIPKETFSREECRRALSAEGKSPNSFLLEQYELLWQNIDVTEYTITLWELNCGKRKLPIREELEQRLTDEQKANCAERIKHLNMYNWSKLRKHLVELRQQQYMLRDSYAAPLMTKGASRYVDSSGLSSLQFKSILPCGVINPDSKFSTLLFMKDIYNEHFHPDFQHRLLTFLIQQDQEFAEADRDSLGVFDFRNLDHVALLIYAVSDLAESQEEGAFDENEYIKQFLDTLTYYQNIAKIDQLHHDIINMKISGHKNDDIARHVNQNYNKTYSANYISTIFRAKCCGGIADAAAQHWAIIDKLTAGEEEFKMCNTCGKILLRDANNYVRKSRSSDGLAGRCKLCDKVARQMKKIAIGGEI